MVTIKDLIEQLQQYDEALEVGVYCDTCLYGGFRLYEDGATMLIEGEEGTGDKDRVFILPSGVEL